MHYIKWVSSQTLKDKDVCVCYLSLSPFHLSSGFCPVWGGGRDKHRQKSCSATHCLSSVAFTAICSAHTIMHTPVHMFVFALSETKHNMEMGHRMHTSAVSRRGRWMFHTQQIPCADPNRHKSLYKSFFFFLCAIERRCCLQTMNNSSVSHTGWDMFLHYHEHTQCC